MVEDLKNEIWYEVEGYEEYHRISNYGRIKVLSRTWKTGSNYSISRQKSEQIITPTMSKGYMVVTLVKNGKLKQHLVHRMIAKAFIPNPNKFSCINHINGIKHDNRIDNLEWCSVQYNTLHSYMKGLQIPKKRGGHNMAKKIKCDTLNLSFDCIKDASEILGVGRRTIHSVLSGNIIHAKGLTFRYL